MTGRFVVDWAIMAVSLFDTILLLWLGLAVILNADRRHWGIWLAGGGLLFGSAFFVSHTAILGHGLHSDGVGTDFWWRAGWVPVLVLPFIWYVVMLWYAGYWDPAGGRVRRRHRLWLLLGTLLLLGLGLLFLLANPLPTYYQVIRFDLSGRPAVRGVALLILLYPIYALGAILLSLDAVWRPAPSGRVMGDVARRRARPWLVGASVVVLLVAAVVGLAMAGVVLGVRGRLQLPATLSRITVVAVLDVTLASLIGAAVVLLGQAVVAYEVFTGKALPRRGLLRHWQRAVGLAAGFGLVVGWSMALGVNPIYGLLLAAGLMTFFYALLSWRSYAERERYIDAVRPFAASPRLYEYLVSHPADPAPGGQVADLFRTLCGDVLGARLAYLVPLGPVTPLVGPGLVYPAGAGPAPPVAGVAHRLAGGAPAHGVALAPADHGGALWAVPLRSRRQLIGVLLLGEKRDGSLYAQEEIEIAQAAGERLMDTLAGAEMARRLMALQRQRLAESQVLDQKARRTLHDDVLPLVHAAMLSLGGDGASHADTVALLADAHRRLSDLLHEMPAPATAEVERLGLAGALRRLVERDLADAFDGVAWRVAHPLPSLPSLPASVLFYAAREAMRNAARHARAGDRPIHLSVTIGLAAGGGVEVVVEDDGAGFDATTLHGGPGAGDGGQGLGLHSTMMAVVGGTLSVDTVPGAGTRVVLALPPGIERLFD